MNKIDCEGRTQLKTKNGNYFAMHVQWLVRVTENRYSHQCPTITRSRYSRIYKKIMVNHIHMNAR